ncbi:D-glycero-beta-D-manno-heptose 1-phosphate adenylyltransferase [Hymenobacter negativus]|uniref:D-glycero-beta-D-manno-heptose 1-phosphate adenylyltransferase n=1 Tax=Hymenobacter negativus TaxID=2795026 RepID=A0ABS0QC13_9BACT|nr:MULTISPECIES: D-glycero-beta-D-manno-heptose 1-phosphate adenylyltransferase [Bacteria]MBH8560239.1 D-glycero-beta-D-manno-heptose 1-phosphate adenylyltransferase [Hymenobacter negativus]MBH8570479.1 D-glycero-beta-D-manno-heptose 1-phosphate adenylyltransferase [Hymenobacter negativus]MBR7210218.1 D-glycero-beta-D-manno-heptose 1-phosphate adenylyltransferase [Microvirga sp. STS02]
MWTKDKILTREQLPATLADWRAQGRKVVFTNGCFDLLHLGHVDYLEQARHLGDALVVGLNTDASVRCLKPGRPIQDEEARARILAALAFVDAVVLFGEPTPLALIELVQPDVLVKGDDYAVERIVGHELVLARGGQVLTVPLVAGYSTSRIVEHIIATQ